MPDQIPPEVVRDRYERLVDVVNEVAWAESKRLVGRRVELMVSEGEGRKDAATHRLSGRARDNRLVHFAPPDGLGGSTTAGIRPGDMVEVEITYAAPHHLVADGPVLAHRRTRSGDAWEARTAPVARRAARRPRHAHRRRPRLTSRRSPREQARFGSLRSLRAGCRRPARILTRCGGPSRGSQPWARGPRGSPPAPG